jgi:hypothetical protein
VVRLEPLPLYPRDIAPCTHCTGGWVHPRGSVDAVEKRKISCPCRKWKPAVQSVTIPTERSRILTMVYSLHEYYVGYCPLCGYIYNHRRTRNWILFQCQVWGRGSYSAEQLDPLHGVNNTNCSNLNNYLLRIYIIASPHADDSGRAVYVMNCLRPLRQWDRGFESHPRHGSLSAFLLCLCCPV